ncbi:MAG TPA: hypothetical protein VGM41_15460 [Chitinophagaceae bacterium]|jgi:hypothetical protein
MLHIFEPFKPIYLPELIKQKRFYLVSQSYHRHLGNLPATETKSGLLISCYEHVNMAKTHVQALTNDRYAAVINLQKPAHRTKMQDLLEEYSKYRVFVAAVKNNAEIEGRINRLYRAQMKRYIEARTDWRISADTTLRPHLHLVFGELFITIKYGNKEIRVKFEEIETA